MIRVRGLVAASVSLLAFIVTGAHAQDQSHAYIRRGREVEANQRALNARLTRFRDSLVVMSRAAAPELLARIDPPPGVTPGYQLLPRIRPAAPPSSTPPRPELVSYSWRWSDTLLAREARALAGLEARLGRVPLDASARPALDSLVTAYRALLDRKRPIDADVNYNWLWQAEIVRLRSVYDGAAKLQQAIIQLHDMRAFAHEAATSPNVVKAPAFDSILNARSATVDSGLDATVRRTDVPAYVAFDSVRDGWRIAVPVYTDIEDTAFINAFERAVESQWRADDGRTAYSVDVRVKRVSARELFCPARADSVAGCVPPVRGATIDVNTHVARFPADGAVLTSGAGSIHVAAGRAIVVSPHDVTTSVLAHEFGHVLGLRDAYLRGAIDDGPGGFIVTELVVDHADIMGNSRTGAVLPSHFERVLAGRDVPALMAAALNELYERRNAMAAIDGFRRVLAKNALHYGANFQLAKALDVAGLTDAGLAQWKVVLDLAVSSSDTATAEMARRRIAGK